MSRNEISTSRLNTLRNANDAAFDSALDAWLQVATGAEVRRNWRKSWGSLPGWAA